MIQEFGDFELDTTRRLLTTRADGQVVDITGRVLDALIYFVERPGQLVEKKALMDALWPNVIVEDGNLSQTIHTLRKVLGEKPGEHRYIATVPGRGYQFVAEVKAPVRDAAEPAPAPVRERSRASDAAPPPGGRALAAIVIVTLALTVAAVIYLRGRHESASPTVSVAAKQVVVQVPAIAVLPFDDMSTEQDQAHFAEGLSEEILNLLTQSSGLRVIARTSSFSFRDENADIKTIAQRLDVKYVLEGSVRKANGRLRIAAQLIDAASSTQLWSQSYDRDFHDVFAVQREIANAVANALSVTLARGVARPAETDNPEAYDHYLQGRFLYNRRSAGDLLQAKAHFEQAVAIDPKYGRAWAGLAAVYYLSPYENLGLGDVTTEWHDAAERAVEFAPDFAEGYVRAAQFYWLHDQRKLGDSFFERGKAVDPEDPMVLGATLSDAIVDGNLDQVVAIQRKIVSIDPLSASNRSNFGCFLVTAGRLQEAQAELERALELSPQHATTQQCVADLLLVQRRGAEALPVVAQFSQGYFRTERMALVHLALGDAAAAKTSRQELEALTTKPDFDPGVALAVAEIHAYANEPDEAFRWLERSIPQTKRQLELVNYWALLESLQISPFLKSLHSDPRWGQLLTKIKAKRG